MRKPDPRPAAMDEAVERVARERAIRAQQLLNDEGHWEGRSEPLDPPLVWTDEGSAEIWRDEQRDEVRSLLLVAEDLIGPQPGVMHPVDRAFYDLTVKERDLARLRADRLAVENDALLAALARLREELEAEADS